MTMQEKKKKNKGNNAKAVAVAQKNADDWFNGKWDKRGGKVSAATLANADYAVRHRDPAGDTIKPRSLDADFTVGGLFSRILDTQSVTFDTDKMAEVILAECETRGYAVDRDGYGNIYATKGEAETYPTFAAHIDTVHDIIDGYSVNINATAKGDIIFSAWDGVNNRSWGVGGDDKVGIYIALKALEILPAGKAAFFLDEEYGCLGSEKADMTFFDDSRFVLQADRKGNGDFIDYIGTTELISDDFAVFVEPIIRRYGRRFANGGMTDVMTLKERGLRVACANMSCGYYEPHSRDEYISWNDVVSTLSMCIEIATGDDRAFPHLLRSKKSAMQKTAVEVVKGATGWDDETRMPDDGDMDFCEFCYDEYPVADMIEITEDKFICEADFDKLMASGNTWAGGGKYGYDGNDEDTDVVAVASTSGGLARTKF